MEQSEQHIYYTIRIEMGSTFLSTLFTEIYPNSGTTLYQNECVCVTGTFLGW